MKIKPRSFESSERINGKGDGPYRGFGSFTLLSSPVYLYGLPFQGDSSDVVLIVLCLVLIFVMFA